MLFFPDLVLAEISQGNNIPHSFEGMERGKARQARCTRKRCWLSAMSGALMLLAAQVPAASISCSFFSVSWGRVRILHQAESIHQKKRRIGAGVAAPWKSIRFSSFICVFAGSAKALFELNNVKMFHFTKCWCSLKTLEAKSCLMSL